ncbi:MAG: tetratricopeptide repeat protein [bacterium]
MLDIFLVVIVLISLAMLANIVMRKFPALASLDIDAIPANKEAQFKQQIISMRLKRSFMFWLVRFNLITRPMVQVINNFFSTMYHKLLELRDKERQGKIVTLEQVDRHVDRLIDEAESLGKQDDFAVAEKKLIEAISLDSKNVEAFKALAHLYFDKKDYEEAKQTFEHVLKLSENDEDAYESLAEIAREGGDLGSAKEDYKALLKINNQQSETYYNLAMVCEATKEYHEAITNIKSALAIEPNNPRYLDTQLRISIITKDKILALDAYGRLKLVNPENQKLDELKTQIDEL